MIIIAIIAQHRRVD